MKRAEHLNMIHQYEGVAGVILPPPPTVAQLIFVKMFKGIGVMILVFL